MRIIVLSGLVLFFVTFASCDKTVEETNYQFPIIELNRCADTSINGKLFKSALILFMIAVVLQIWNASGKGKQQ